jgi:protein-S-isoprenylcysteine O-methyltransferase Ste14
MSQQSSVSAPTPRLTRSGITRVITVLGSSVVVAALFFAAAGRVDVPRAWLYYGGTMAYQLVAMVVLLVLFPGVTEVVNERGKAFKQDVKRWDKVFGLGYSLLLLVLPVVAGLDAERFHWSRVGASLLWPALGATILATSFVQWAMVVNRHAETGVRIQRDRKHAVVSTGPYRFVRHPFYISLILIQLVYPLAVGSLYAYLPALAMAVLFLWRTAREDATLCAELPGYAEYAARVRYRLLPGVW